MSNFFKNDFNIIFNKNSRTMSDIFIYEVGFEKCSANKSIEFIPIDYYLIHYCVSGEGTLRIYDKEYKISKGDLFLIPPKTDNKYKPIKENPWHYCWIGLNGISVKSLLEHCGLNKDCIVLHLNETEKFFNCFNNIYDDCFNNNHLKGLSNLFLLLSYLSEQNSSYKEQNISASKTYLKNILDYIHNNYQEDIRISNISSKMNIDRTYVYKLFKKYLNMSPQQYILNYRLEKAKLLLVKSNLSLTDISSKLGFNTHTHFVNNFKKNVGVSPLEFRKQNSI